MVAGNVDPGSEYYVSSQESSYPIQGLGGMSDRNLQNEGDSHSGLFNGSDHNGATKAYSAVKDGLNQQWGSLNDKMNDWSVVEQYHANWASQLDQIGTDLLDSGIWQGDDADKARIVYSGSLGSSQKLAGYSSQMYQSIWSVADAVQTALAQSSNSGDSGFMGTGWGDSDGDSKADTAAYATLVTSLDQARNSMTSNVEMQNKTYAGKPNIGGLNTGGTGGTGGMPGLGNSGMPSHVNPNSLRKIPVTKKLPLPNNNDGNDGNGPGKLPNPITDPITNPIQHPISGTNPPITVGNPVHGIPGIDTHTHLASGGGSGLGSGDFGGGGGAGVGGLGGGLGGGFGGGGAGSLSGGGLGGGLGGASGAGGLGAGAAGLAAEEAEQAAAAAGRGGVGGAGMMPMRGGGGAGGDNERDRSTWLTEDDDVWGGGDDAPPSTIS